eukprot:CAMPEP_0119047394 /NCGR_PEP_ID=MMETSP1177-20130426/52931_1 /TAXON_ID=2985 /ORGANISM="Ochromonas sp, Strain CCMP1899" /LENGTH=531 /DNA_ID=CAMNT_0007021945 /DNA_START=243 /DNA_END=1835 /DNA_ORIENTATION=-
MGETEISPLPTRGKSRSPGSYNKSPTSQNIYDYTEYEGNDAFKSSERDHLSSLAINLSHQMEYNNTLLQQVETLELNQVETKEKFQFFETDIIQLRSALRTSTEKSQVSERKLGNMVLQNATISEENRSLREDANNTAAEAVRLSAQAEAQKRRSGRIEDSNTSQQQRVTHLEGILIIEKNKHRSELEKLTNMVIDLEATLIHTKSNYEDSENVNVDQESQLRESREETITLQRSVANLSRIGMEEMEAKNELVSEVRDLTARNIELTKNYQETRLKLGEKEELCLMLSGRLEESLIQQGRAEEEVSISDAKWRKMEEIIRSKNHDLKDTQDHCSQLENTVETLLNQVEAADIRVEEFDSLLRATSEQHADSSKKQSESMTFRLTQETDRLTSERTKHELMYSQLLTQVSELQSLLSVQRAESSSRFSEMTNSRDLGLAAINVLEKEKSSLERSKRNLIEAFKEKEDMLHEKLKENRVAATQKGEHFVSVLTIIKTSVRDLMEEGRLISEQLSYINTQQQRLSIIMHELSG